MYKTVAHLATKRNMYDGPEDDTSTSKHVATLYAHKVDGKEYRVANCGAHSAKL
jgi:hypothetical protein